MSKVRQNSKERKQEGGGKLYMICWKTYVDTEIVGWEV